MDKMCKHFNNLQSHLIKGNQLSVVESKERIERDDRNWKRLFHETDKLSSSKDKPQRHIHSLEIKSSRDIILYIVILLIMTCSILFNLYQNAENNRLVDNDFKFRYILLNQGISSQELEEIEIFFEYDPDHQKQKHFIKHVKQKEHAIEKRIKEIERARLAGKEVQELFEEAERLKDY